MLCPKHLLLVLFVIIADIAFAQEFSMHEYKKVFDVIKSDSELSQKYCGSDSMRLTVHPSFDYCPISMFDNLAETALTELEIKRLKKIDAKQSKNQNLLTYKVMMDEFYSSLTLDPSPCVIVCFDRLKDFLIVAQVTTFGLGLDWKRLSLNKNIDVFIFDIRKEPYTYKRFSVIR
ncbi:MAG: hypothetical protein HYZ44_13610 [Bacteroidetes bacterium]|nr:hypothetical protein [Bacteroidota bacterium]